MPSTSNTSPATPAAHPDVPPFPSPSTFSILPDIWLLLARLNILHQQHPHPQQQQTQAQTNGHQHQHHHLQQQPSSSSPQQGQQPPSQNPSSSTPSQASQPFPPPPSLTTQQQQQPPPPSTGTGAGVGTGAGTAPIFHGAPLLDLKDLPAQTYPLKQRLVKARAAVTGLPDVDRTVAEQEDEIRRLERMVRGIKGRLGLLGEIAAKVGTEDGDGVARDVEMKDEDEHVGDEERVEESAGGGTEGKKKEEEEG